MEYEISDEDVLFDDSTNPSLEKRKQRPPAPAKGEQQKAVPIPEEEDEFA